MYESKLKYTCAVVQWIVVKKLLSRTILPLDERKRRGRANRREQRNRRAREDNEEDESETKRGEGKRIG